MALGEIFHTIRYSNSWQPWGNVSQAVANNPGQFVSVSCASIGYDLHVIGMVPNGKLYHTIRYSNSWQPWGNVSQAVANNPGQFVSVSCAGIGDDLHVVGFTPSGKLYHTIRYSNSWQSWDDVSAKIANNPGKFDFVTCANVGNELHVLGLTPSGKLYHTIRYADGKNWQDWGDVSLVPNNPGKVASVCCSGIKNDLHIVVFAYPGLHHAIRDSNKVWRYWSDVTYATRATTATPSLACARVGCGGCHDLHLIYDIPNGELYHTIRFSNYWQVWGDVSNGVANNPVVSGGDDFKSISCAGIGDELHVLCIATQGIPDIGIT
jgi:hypothetical protein